MTDPLKATPPAIVRADSAEMDQLAFEITSALEAGAKAGRTALERHREAGDALRKAKEKCPKGQWLKWLAAHQIDRMVAWRAIQIASNWDDCEVALARVTSVREAMQMLAEVGEEAETGQQVASSTTPEPKRCRDCRINGPKLKCKACQEIQKQEAEQAARNGSGGTGKPPSIRTSSRNRSSGSPERSGPGDDSAVEDADKAFTGPAETAKALWLSRLATLSKVRQTEPDRVGRIQRGIAGVFQGIVDLEKLPFRPVPDPKPSKCSKCGQDTLVVTSAKKGSRFQVDAIPFSRGSFRLIGGLAVFVKANPTDELLYSAHRPKCPKGDR